MTLWKSLLQLPLSMKKLLSMVRNSIKASSLLFAMLSNVIGSFIGPMVVDWGMWTWSAVVNTAGLSLESACSR